jgi:uncharacterized protein YrrD
MIVNSNDIRGKKIISEKEGKELATADDLFFDTNKKKVVAILTDSQLGFENARAVLLSKVKSIGETIIIGSETDLMKAADALKPDSGADGDPDTLVGSKEVTKSGDDLGTISNISFDSKSGDIKETTSDDNGEEKKAQIKKVVTSSEEMTVVDGKEKNPNQKSPIDQLKSVLGK